MKAHFRAWFDQTITEKGWIAQLLRKIRRFYLGTFKTEYVLKSIAENREGECHRCGLCCELVYKCPFLGRDSKKLPYCRIYGDLRPSSCHYYPFDRIDSEVEQCGFKFKAGSPVKAEQD